MEERIIIAGFGGQGILLLGKVLAYAGMIKNKHVSWIPSYGPEMRGGTANCNVVISDDIVGSPLVAEPTTLIAMNRPSLEKFESTLAKDGLLLYNKSIIEIEPKRTDIVVYPVDATNIANKKLGNTKLSNMVMVGAYLKAKGIFSVDTIKEALEKSISKRHHHLLPKNMEAIELGMAEIK